MGMELTVARSVVERLLAEAANAAPAEACGLLLGPAGTNARIDQVQPAANVADAPCLRFEIDPAALIAAYKAERADGATLVGYYHSHPTGGPEPSAVDRAEAAGDGKVWAIAAQGTVRFWRDLPVGFEPLSYALASG
jgi:desampylase